MTEEQLRAQLDAVYSSTSWRLTAPLRHGAALLKSSRFRADAARRLLFSVIRSLGRIPLVRKSGAQILKLFPGLHSRVKNVVLARNLDLLLPPATETALPAETSELSPSAHAILIRLQKAIRESSR